MLTIYRELGGAFLAAVAEHSDGVAIVGCDESANELRATQLRNAQKYATARVRAGKATWSKYQAWGPNDFYDDMVRVVAALPAARLRAWLGAVERKCGDAVRVDQTNDALFAPDLPAVAIAFDKRDKRWQVRLPSRSAENVHTNVPADSQLLYAAALLPLFDGEIRVTRCIRWADLCSALKDREVEVLQNPGDDLAFADLCGRVARECKWETRARIALGEEVCTPWAPVLL